MNNVIKHIYVAILNNRVVAIETNLSAFVLKLKVMESGINSLSYYQKSFKNKEILYYTSGVDKVYTLQKIVNSEFY